MVLTYIMLAWGAEHRGRPRGIARSRLRRLLRRRRLFLRAARPEFRFFVLGMLAARGHPRLVLGNPARLSGAPAPARRLSCHRHARLRRNHPPRDHQLAEPHRRPERNFRHSATELLRHSLQQRTGRLCRAVSPRIHADASRGVFVLRHPRARTSHLPRDDPFAPASDRGAPGKPCAKTKSPAARSASIRPTPSSRLSRPARCSRASPDRSSRHGRDSSARNPSCSWNPRSSSRSWCSAAWARSSVSRSRRSS